MAGVGKAAVAGLGAAATAFGGLSIKALQMGGDLEQSIGGIETLFKGSADIVIKNAENAYKTAGVNANDYMQQVTSFSASLLQSLGGDTEAAAKVADMAIVDMADNANKMGSSIESIQMAYQGFAKQNYTMLDNLKLGYGGTKTEMERLLADAEKLSGVKYDISNLDDVYEAIHVIQGELDITGTTAKEGMETFSGSIQTAKAALANFLSGAGDVNSFVKALVNVGNVVAKNLKALLPRLTSGIFEIARQLVPMVPGIFAELLPAFIEGGAALLEGIVSVLPGIVDALSGLLPTVVTAIIGLLPTILDAGIKIVTALAKGIGNALPTLIPAVMQAIITIGSTLFNAAPELISVGLDLMFNLAAGIFSGLGEVGSAITSVWNAIKSRAEEIWPTISTAIVGAWDSVKTLGKEAWTNLSDAVTGAWNTVSGLADTAWTNLVTAVSNAWDGVKKFTGAVWDKVVGFVTGAWDAVGGLLGTAWTGLSQAISDTWASVKTFTGAVWDKVAGFVTGAWDTVKELTGDAWTNLTGHLSTAWGKVKGFITDNVWGTISENVTGAWEDIKGAFSEGTAFNDFESALAHMRKNAEFLVPIITGLTTGIIAFTIAKKAAAVATALFNSTLAVTPVGLVTVAIAGLVGVVATLISKTNEATAGQKAMNEAAQESRDAYNALQGTMAKNAASFDDTIAGIDANALASSKLVEQMYSLAAAEGDSTESKARQAAAIRTLNEAMPGLELAYDAETGALNKTVEQVNAYIDAKKQQAKLTAINERAAEVAKEMVDIELKLTEARKQAVDPATGIALATGNMTKETVELTVKEKELQAQYEEREGVLTSLMDLSLETSATVIQSETAQGDAVTATTDIMTEAYAKQNALVAEREAADKAATDAMILNANELGLTLEEYTAQQEEQAKREAEILEERKATLDSYIEAATNAFSTISTSSDVSASKMMENMEANAEAVANWVTNLETLFERGLNPDKLIELMEQGPEKAAGVVAELAKSTTDIEAYNQTLGESVATAEDAATRQEALKDRIVAASGETTTASETLTTTAETAATTMTDTETAATALGESIATASDNMTAFIDSANAVATTTIPEIITSIETQFEALPGKIIAYYDLIVESTKTWVTNLISVATRDIPRFVTAAENAVKPVVEKFRSIGKETAKAWWAGFESETGPIYAGLKSFIDKLIAQIQSASSASAPFLLDAGIGATAPVMLAGSAQAASEQAQGGVTINQYIETVPQTPEEFGAVTAMHFERARWVTG